MINNDDCTVLNVEYVVEDVKPMLEGSKGGEEKPHQPVETPNNLLSIAYAKVLVAVGEGPLHGTPTGRDIYLNGTPLIGPSGEDNFGGVTWEWRNGTQDQEYIQGNPSVTNEFQIGFPLTQITPWTRQITKTDLSAIRVTLATSALMQQLENGDTVGYKIDYAIDLSTDGGPYVEYGQYSMEGKTNTTYERTHRVNLPPAPTAGWQVRVRRLSPDTNLNNIQDKLSVKSYTEVIDEKYRYPNTALLFVQFDSKLFGGGSIPKISVKVEGREVRVPSNYDPRSRVYSGVWDGSFKWDYTDNPAWVFFDIVTQERFGLGNRVNTNQISKWDLYEIAQYCDVMVDDGTGAGTKEPRYTCNVYIAALADAWQVLRDICSIFNGMTYWNGNQIVAIADKPEPVSNIPLFSRSNVVDGFDYQSTDERSIYTSALISYDDPADHYSTKVEASWEKSEILRWRGDRQVTLSAIGCTSRGEAQRKGKYTLLTNLLNRSVVFRTGLQGMDEKVLPGKIVGIADPLIAGKPFTGRLIAGTPKVVTLDRPTEAKAGDILFIHTREGVQVGRTIESVSGNVITVTTAYNEVPMKDTVWYLEASDLKSQLFKVTKITQPDPGVYEITAVEYNESKFAAIDNGARLENRPISKVPPAFIRPPFPITVTAQTFIEQTMAVTTMTASWEPVENAVLYEVQFRTNMGDWIPMGITGVSEIDVKGIYTGDYVVRVRSINSMGIKSTWGMSAVTKLEGKQGKPPTLAYFNTIPQFLGIDLQWGFKPFSEDTLRTEIMYSENSNFENAIHLGDYAYPQSTHAIRGISAGKEFFFWARLIDRTGNIGDWFPLSTEQGIQGKSKINDNGEYNDYFAGLIGETALDKTLYDRIELIDGNGPGSVNERLETAVTELEEKIANITDALVYDPLKSYVRNDVVRLGQKLYQAQKDVPVGVSPPNEEYWKDVGTILEEANGLASRVDVVEVKIENVEGQVTSVVTSLESMQAAYRDDDGVGSQDDAIVGWNSRAQISTEREVRASQNEATARELVVFKADIANNSSRISSLTEVVTTNNTATSTRIDNLTATVKLDNYNVNAALTEERSARATADTAITTRVDSLSATVTTEFSKTNAAITTESTARAQGDAAISNRVDTIEAGLITDTQVKALIQVETTARVGADNALGQRIDTVQVQVGNQSASIQEIRTAQITTDGKINQSWTLKMEQQTDGKYVAAGIGLGIENGPAGLQSQFLVRADRFAVVSGLNGTQAAPFVVQGGQVFISQALIGTAWITNAMIGNVIQSNNFVPNSTGWQLDKSGSLQINGNVAGGGRLTLNNQLLQVFDAAGQIRVRLGIWQ